MAYLHGRGVVHRDIKAENILVSSPADAAPTVKLADFGLARQLAAGAPAAGTAAAAGGGTPSTSDTFSLSSVLGTPAYLAPEVVAGRRYGPPVDVWSVGVLAHILLTGRLPFPPAAAASPAAILGALAAGRVVLGGGGARWGALSAAARSLVASLLCVEPGGRPAAAAAVGHPWLGGRRLVV